MQTTQIELTTVGIQPFVVGLDNCLGRSKDRENNPAKSVDGSGRTENGRPALGQLENVTS